VVEMLNAELNLTKLSVSVLLVYKEIRKTFALKLVVELILIVPSMRNVTEDNPFHKRENAKDSASEIRVHLERHAKLKIIERYALAILH
jgi:hypothetical protein